MHICARRRYEIETGLGGGEDLQPSAQQCDPTRCLIFGAILNDLGVLAVPAILEVAAKPSPGRSHGGGKRTAERFGSDVGVLTQPRSGTRTEQESAGQMLANKPQIAR